VARKHLSYAHASPNKKRTFVISRSLHTDQLQYFTAILGIHEIHFAETFSSKRS